MACKLQYHPLHGTFGVCLWFQASMIWIIGEYAERIDNAAELLESFLESFLEEPQAVQLQLLTATVKLFLKKPTEGPQQMIQVQYRSPVLSTLFSWFLPLRNPKAAKGILLVERVPEYRRALSSPMLLCVWCWRVQMVLQRGDPGERQPQGSQGLLVERGVSL